MAESILGKINYLTEEQYQNAKANGQINEDEIYLTPDGDMVEYNTVLWQNPNPNATTFAAQNITLSSANYDYFDILYYCYTDVRRVHTARVYKNQAAASLSAIFVFNNTMYAGERALTRVSDTVYSISSTRGQAFTGTGNASDVIDWLIPIAIYGGKRQKETITNPSLRTIHKLTLTAVAVTTAASATVLNYTIPESGIYLLMGYSNINKYNNSGRELRVNLNKNGVRFWQYLDVGHQGWTTPAVISATQEFVKGDKLTVVIENGNTSMQWMHGQSELSLVKL